MKKIILLAVIATVFTSCYSPREQYSEAEIASLIQTGSAKFATRSITFGGTTEYRQTHSVIVKTDRHHEELFVRTETLKGTYYKIIKK